MATRALLLTGLMLPLALKAELSVHTDFAGGSARVIAVDQAKALVQLMPGGDITRGWPCWWCVRIEGAQPGQEITLELAASDQLQKQPGSGQGKPLAAAWSRPARPAVSDDGATWRHGPEGKLVAGQMVYRVQAAAGQLWIAWGPLFTSQTGGDLIDRITRESPLAARLVLATTREGREVPALRIATGTKKPVVWFQARQHAWESGGSWVAAGLMNWLVSNDPLAVQLRDRTEILVVPVMDVDHVATGDGGKDALPQDHNRDWQAQPHWPEVAAAQHLLRDFAAQKRLRLFCDLHNPSPGDKKSYFYVTPKDILGAAAWDSQHRFFDLARQEFTGPIPLEITPRESGPSYHPLWKQISKNWVHDQCGLDVIAVTLETAWNTPGSTVEGYQQTGASLGRAVSRFMEPR
ncbi:MAG: M14 family zinc carboxypeptidase [Prosthecobacter sp.]|nr:M14 family zinc carboxypeptidase [Prosthecobacter sp.]